MYGKEIKKVLITKEQISKRVKELGEQITRDYEGEELTKAVLNGKPLRIE